TISLDGCGPVQHLVEARHELSAVRVHGVERPAANKLLNHAPVNFLRIHPLAEVMNRSKRPILPAVLQNYLYGPLADVFHRPEPEAYLAPHDLEGPAALIYVRGKNSDFH